jgi:hypothetical protein
VGYYRTSGCAWVGLPGLGFDAQQLQQTVWQAAGPATLHQPTEDTRRALGRAGECLPVAGRGCASIEWNLYQCLARSRYTASSLRTSCLVLDRWSKKNANHLRCVLITASPRQCRGQDAFGFCEAASEGLSATRGVTSTVAGFRTSAPPGIGSSQRKQNGSPNTITRPSYSVCSESS